MLLTESSQLKREKRGWEDDENDLLMEFYEKHHDIIDGHAKSQQIRFHKKQKWNELAEKISAYVLLNLTVHDHDNEFSISGG